MLMASILTISHPLDVHADAVGWALEQRGHDMLLWNFAEFPSTQRATLTLSPGGEVAVAFPPFGERCAPPAMPGSIDVVWHRRPSAPTASDELPESDRTVAIRESRVFCNAAPALLAGAARWVNPEGAARAAEFKPLQLRAALKAGLAIPDTICSNDPDEVRRFARKHRGRIICKLFRPAAWQGRDKHYSSYTALVDEAVLANDFAVAAAPAIYQPFIDRRYELRVTIMGSACVAAKLTFEAASGPLVDARVAYTIATAVEVELPAAIRNACLRLMEELGLVFGCLDLIATGNDEILFLEVNQMGQFLWLEGRNPEIPLLSVFTEFIASGRPDFQRTRRRDGVSMAAYRQSERARRVRALLQQTIDRNGSLGSLVLQGVPEPESDAEALSPASEVRAAER
jgi:glutathione synthase/RimK-type ligase-like ATP-grasp enzyme